MQTTNEVLAHRCHYMATHGGYVLAFSTSVAVEYPDLSWQVFRRLLLANGHGFCGYAEDVVRRAFERGRAAA